MKFRLFFDYIVTSSTGEKPQMLVTFWHNCPWICQYFNFLYHYMETRFEFYNMAPPCSLDVRIQTVGHVLRLSSIWQYYPKDSSLVVTRSVFLPWRYMYFFMHRAIQVRSRLSPLVSERWNSITVLLTHSHQCRRLVKKRPSMCYYVCVIMHVKDP